MMIEEWAKDFKSYVNEAQLFRDDYNSIMEYIDDGISLLKEQEAKIEQLNKYVNEFSRDAMPVVRCKDCKHGYKCEFSIRCENKTMPSFGQHFSKNWFCAEGERKDDFK